MRMRPDRCKANLASPSRSLGYTSLIRSLGRGIVGDRGDRANNARIEYLEPCRAAEQVHSVTPPACAAKRHTHPPEVIQCVGELRLVHSAINARPGRVSQRSEER